MRKGARTVATFGGLVIAATLLTSCDQNGDLSDVEVEEFFRQHTIEGNRAVAMKKRSPGVTAYLGTIHGYPNNLSVCEEVLAPYNNDASRSAIPGEYFCEELR
jgi:hypothetical protein